MSVMNIKQYLDGPVRDFSIYNCERSLPSGVDGLKTSQRKVLFGMLKKFPTQEVKVSIASSGISEISAYHHGSLDGVVVNMAQSFTGANNIPLLNGIGQFGSRITPESAAARYIFVQLNKNIRNLFNPDDDAILEYLDDDGQSIEPRYYMPTLPLALINGIEGMGTGFASSIMAYNPADLKSYIVKKLAGQKYGSPLTPWYRGFTGTIERESAGSQVVCNGVVDVINTSTLKITELPIGTYTIKYRETLNALEDKGIVKNYTDNSTEEKTEFVVKVSKETATLGKTALLKLFKLTSRYTENITVWDENSRLVKFNRAEDLLDWFIEFRLVKLEQRRQSLIAINTERQSRLAEHARFITLYLKRSKAWSGMNEPDIISELIAEGMTRVDELLAIRIRRLTGEAIAELNDKINVIGVELTRLASITPKDMYKTDLASLKL